MKNNAPKSGFFSIRVLLAWTLCSLAALLLGLVSLPAPGGQGGTALASSNAAVTQIGATPTSMPCPGPAICGQTCSLDPNGVPIYCSNGQCTCAPGYDTVSGPTGLVCTPHQPPEFIGTEASGDTTTADCPGSCTSTPWGNAGSPNLPFDIVAVHGTAPGGEAFNPVWGAQATNPNCGVYGVQVFRCEGGKNDGLTCSTATAAKDCPGGTCDPIRSWASCTPDPYPFCVGIQNAPHIDQYDPPTCDPTQGCGRAGCDLTAGTCTNDDTVNCSSGADCPPTACVSDFTGARPYLDSTFLCGAAMGFDNPARFDFPNNVSVYRARIMWEDHSLTHRLGGDDDYTWDVHSPGAELYDQRPPCTAGKCNGGTGGDCTTDSDCGSRVHVEFDSSESIDNFSDSDLDDNPFGTASQWWTELHHRVDDRPSFGDDAVRNAPICCWLRQLVSPGLDCSVPSNLTCDALSGIAPSGIRIHDPMAVVVGVPSLDCGDHPKENTSEIHPAYALAIRIQETCASRDPDSGVCTQTQPEGWAFFYRQKGNNGQCGNTTYSRCLSTFQLPLGLPDPPPGYVLTGGTVDVQWHPWADGVFVSPSSDIKVNNTTDTHFVTDLDLTNGTVLTIHLPSMNDGVVGLVTVTPTYETTPPTIACSNITTPVDLGKCTAAVTFAPVVSDNCSVSTVCSMPSGSAFPIGTTTDTCTATNQAGLTASCTFNVTVTAGNKCPLGMGYWKNHTNLWPVNSLTLGSVTYTKAQLINILNHPTVGDASLILAKSEIAALLNLANGSSPLPICDTIADADSTLGGCAVPCKIPPRSTTGQRMISDANTLDAYNNGKLTTGCTR